MRKLLAISILILFLAGEFSASAFARTDGGHNTIGATAASTTWYFAEGYTGDSFEEWLCLQNPSALSAGVNITYMFRGGEALTKTITIPAYTRETLSVNSDVGPNQEVSIKIESDQAIIAERPMYFNYQGKGQGGHNTIGATSPRFAWYFAEGYTGAGFHEYICLQNPGDTSSDVTIAYRFRGGGGTTQYLTIEPGTRETVYVNSVVGPDREVSVKVTSNQLIVAERPMYFDFRGYDGGHNVLGAVDPSYFWYFAEGYTGYGFQEYLTLQNPNANPATVSICYMYRDG